MKHIFLIIITFSLLITGVSSATEIASLGSTNQPFKSIFKEDTSLLFFLNRSSSFYDFYSFKASSPYFILRKIGHFLTYGFIAGIIFVILPSHSLRSRALLSSTSASFTGLMDEIHQHFLINRGGRLMDVIINTTGSLFFAFLLSALYLLTVHIKKPNLKK